MAFQQQPQQMMAVTTTTTNHAAGMWSTGLFDCCSDMSTCCCGCCCFPCLQCQTVSSFGWCCGLPLIDSGVILGTTLRSSVRERYGIQGSSCDDCCMMMWCNLCVWCQMSREIKMRKRVQTSVVTTQVFRG